MTRRALLIGLVAAVAVTGPVTYRLSQSAPDEVDFALANDRLEVGRAAIAVLDAPDAAVAKRTVPLWVLGSIDVTPSRVIDLLMSSGDDRPVTLRPSDLRIGSCRYRLTSPVVLTSAQLVPFVKRRPCDANGATTAQLFAEASGPGRLAIWTWQMPADGAPDHAGLSLTDPAAGAPANSVVRGHASWVRSANTVRRLDLLAWLWQVQPATLLALIMTAAVALGLGCALIAVPAQSRSRLGAGAGLVAGALGLMWAVVMPPLQAADEASHLLSYGNVNRMWGFETEVRGLAQRTHFERIRFHTDEHFRPVNREAVFPEELNTNVHAEPMARRSPLAIVAWRLTAAIPGVTHLPLPQLLLALRLVDALWFALIAGAAAFVVVTVSAPGGGLWPLFGFTVVPTLPYFATMFSDWALFTSLTVLASTAVIVLWQDGPRSAWSGVPLGLSLALLTATAVASLTLLPLFGVLLIMRIAMGATDHGAHGRGVWLFWGGLGGGLAVVFPLLRPLLAGGYQRYDAQSGSGFAMLAAVNTALHVLAAAPWIALVGLAAAALVELAFVRLRAWRSLQVIFGRLVVAIAVLVALALVGGLVASIFIQFTPIETIETHTYGSAVSYGLSVLRHALTNARLTNFDHLLFSSFWSGFGWVDAILPNGLLAVLTTASVMAFGVLVARLVWRQDARRIGWTVGLLGGATASLFASAVASFLLHRNLHGRYLIGLYVPVIAIVWQAIVPGGAGTGQPSGVTRAVRLALIGAVVALHAYCLFFVSARYL